MKHPFYDAVARWEQPMNDMELKNWKMIIDFWNDLNEIMQGYI